MDTAGNGPPSPSTHPALTAAADTPRWALSPRRCARRCGKPSRSILLDLTNEDVEAVAVHRFDVRRTTRELGRVDRRDATREREAVGADELDAVAGAKVLVPACDADGQETRTTVDERSTRTFVDVHTGDDALSVPQPELERRRGFARGKARAAGPAGKRAGDHALARAIRDERRDARACGKLRRSDLALHPASSERVAWAERDLTRRRAVLDQHPFPQDPCDRREEHEHPRPDQHGHLRGERVVVAEADLVGRRRVVLVDDRHGAEREERVQRAAGVDVRAALADLGAREQDLRGVEPVRAERVLPRTLE